MSSVCTTLIWGSLTVIGVVSCSRSVSRPPPAASSDSIKGRPECPGEGALIFQLPDSHGTIHTVTKVTLSGKIAGIPEFHDCQQFIRSTEPKSYDALYAIFAAFRLGDRIKTLGPGQDSLRNLLGIPADSITLRNHRRVPSVAVATIFSASVNVYAPLRIHPGFNCLVLYQTSATMWGAKMVPLSIPDSNCAKPGVAGLSGTTLAVRRRSDPNLSLGDYPQVARWDWDSVHNEQYIGIMCGRAWCEVGNASPEFTPSAFLSVDNLPPGIAGTRVVTIKGWYDAQFLGIQSDSGLVPSEVYGVIIPNPTLETMASATVASETGAQPSAITAYDNHWVNVGVVYVSGNYKAFKAGVNIIDYCRGPSNGPCKVPVASQPLPPAPWKQRLASCDSAQAWWARVRPPVGKPFFVCVRVRDHGPPLEAAMAAGGDFAGWKISLPASARWRWLVDDESGGWYGCQSSSCCTQQ